MKSTPAWFRSVNTFTKWPQMPRAHGPFGKDRITPQERRDLAGVPLFLNVQHASAVRDAHRLGGRALSYISFYDTYVHTDGFENGTARAPWNPRRAPMLLLDAGGSFVNTPMDSSRRMWRYLVCNNTREYVDAALEMVREQMERGADGLFIDNAGSRAPCYGHGVPVGYSEQYRQVISSIPQWPDEETARRTPPDELHRKGVHPSFRPLKYLRDLQRHRHIYPGRDHTYAFGQLLRRVRALVRSYGKDRIIVVNGERKADCADGVMLESYIYSWGWKGPRVDWPLIRSAAAKWQPYIANGGRVLALTYLGNTDRAPSEDGLHAFAAAAVSGFLWSDYSTCADAVGSRLRRARLGARVTPLIERDGLAWALFRSGVAVVNPTPSRRRFDLDLPASLRSGLVDLRTGDTLTGTGRIRLTLPPRSGTVLCKDIAPGL